jgi:hypothetical protein
VGGVPAPAVELEVPARPEYVAVVRLALASLGRLVGLDEVTVEDLKIAVSEATTSAILVNRAGGGRDLRSGPAGRCGRGRRGGSGADASRHLRRLAGEHR